MTVFFTEHKTKFMYDVNFSLWQTTRTWQWDSQS